MRKIFWAIILIQVAFGLLYAVKTPRWQAPDEPAHFNYVRQIAETGTLPELGPGDYDYAYLEKAKADKFAPGISIDSIRYESYQPPLYYLLAAPVYVIARAIGLDPALALRLFSVALGALLLILAKRVLDQVFPANPLLVLAAVGLMATIPMHIAMSAAINADTFAEVLIAILLLLSFSRISGQSSTRQFILWGGVTYGLALLTSTKVYAGALLLVLAELGYWRQASRIPNTEPMSGTPRSRREKRGSESIRNLALLFGLALVISSWMFARNALVYGGLDILGWARHDMVVQGQLTTAQAVAQDGLKNVVADFFIITFKSFWALFGWMGVLVNDRIYVGLFILALAALGGAVLWILRVVRERPIERAEVRWKWGILGAWLVTLFLAHVWYNLRYVQPQGRYLFPALIPIAAFFVVGLHELIAPRYARLVFALLYVIMLGLDLASLFWFIIPQLTTWAAPQLTGVETFQVSAFVILR